MWMVEKFLISCEAVGVVVVMILYVCFGSVPCGGDSIPYTFVCCPDLFSTIFQRQNRSLHTTTLWCVSFAVRLTDMNQWRVVFRVVEFRRDMSPVAVRAAIYSIFLAVFCGELVRLFRV